jgi:multiple sugar transport system substrate-binding protein
VRLIWWGNPDRDRRTNEVIDLYMKETGTEVVPETYAWNDYWQKLATQAAGKNLPDLIQMDYRYIFEYARRQQLAALDDLVGAKLAEAKFDPNQLASGKVDGKLYGVSMGANSIAYIYNQALLGKLGIELPDPTTWTNEDLAALGEELKGKLPEGMYLTQNMGYWEPRLDNWVRQRGKSLYTEDGQLGYELEDLTAFFAYWKDMQDKGLTPPADIQSQDSDGKMETSMVVTGRSLFGGTNSNQLVAHQKLMPDEVNITMFPNQKDGKPGQYLKPSMFLSMAETSADKEAAAKLMEFFITDPKANAILQIERGVSGDPAVREAILPGLSDAEKKIITYLDIVATSVGPLPPPPPKSAGELDRALRPAWDAISFGKVSVEDGAKQYYDNAVAILARA